MKNNILIVCYSVGDIKKIKKINFSYYNNIIIASDDLNVQLKCLKKYPSCIIISLEQSISYQFVSDDVILTIEKINAFYENIEYISIFDYYQIAWQFHIEGGYQQEVQDTFLYIESLDYIVSKYSINTIYLLGTNTLNNLIKLYSSHRCLQISIDDNMFKRIILNNKAKWFFLLRILSSIVRTFFIKIKSREVLQKKESEANIALVQLMSKEQKHLNHLFDLIDDFKNNKIHTLIFSSQITKINIVKEKYKNNFVDLERFLTWKIFFISILKSFKQLCKRKKVINEYDLKMKIVYKGINLSLLFKDTIIGSSFVNAPIAYRFEHAYKNIINKVNPIIAHVCCADSFVSGKLIAKNLKKKIVKFNYTYFMHGYSPYNDYSLKLNKNFYIDNNFFLFVPNEMERDDYLKYDFINKNNVSVYNSHTGIKKLEYTKDEALKELRISNKYKYYILFDYPVELLGYSSSSEIKIMIDFLYDFLKKSLDIFLLIKPHPSASLDIIKLHPILTELKNSCLIDKNKSLALSLTISDVLITKFSAIGTESMLYDCNVISYLFDKNNKIKFYGDAGHYIYSKEQLEKDFDNIFKSDNSYNLWKTEIDKRRKYFLFKYATKVSFDTIGLSLSKLIYNKNEDYK